MAVRAACSNSEHTVFFGTQAVATWASVSGIKWPRHPTSIEMSWTINPAYWRSYNKALYLSSLRALAANRCCWVVVGMVSSNKYMKLLETRTKSGLLRVVENLVGIVLGHWQDNLEGQHKVWSMFLKPMNESLQNWIMPPSPCTPTLVKSNRAFSQDVICGRLRGLTKYTLWISNYIPSWQIHWSWKSITTSMYQEWPIINLFHKGQACSMVTYLKTCFEQLTNSNSQFE